VINLHAIEFVSNFIKHNSHASVVCDSSFLLFTVNLPSTYRKFLYGNMCKWYPYHCVSKRCVGIRIVCVSFNLDYAIIENCFQCSRYQPYSIWQNDFKNLTAAVSFFLGNLLSFLWIFLIVVSALKMSLAFYLFVQSEHLTWRLRTCSLTVIFFCEIEQSTVLIYNTNHQVHNALCNDWKVNNLCRRFRYLISWWHIQQKFMYRIYVVVCTGGYVALDANNVYVDDTKAVWKVSDLTKIQDIFSSNLFLFLYIVSL